MKRIISLLLAFVMILPISGLAAFAQDDNLILKIDPYGAGESSTDMVKLFISGSECFMFLPGGIDREKAKVYYSAPGGVSVDGRQISSGESASAFTPGEHSMSAAGNDYTLRVFASSDIPAVYINTESGSLDYIHGGKDHKENAVISIYQNGVKTLDGKTISIKGRGNATWSDSDKKPYNIKFDSKTDLFGMGSAKKWTLMANYFDETLLRNVYGWEYAKAFGLYYTSQYKHVDLYINSEYRGNYVICESVEVGRERVNIDDLDDANEKANPDLDWDNIQQGGTGYDGEAQPGTDAGSAKWAIMDNSPDDITGGYLMEYEYPERYDNDFSGFVTDNGQAVVLKSPEYATESEVKYIQGIVNDATNALYSKTGYNDKGKHYSDYFDMDSLVNTYIIQEMSNNIDAGSSSFYLFKRKNSDKIYFSPFWDVDHGFGDNLNRFGVNIGDPDIWWANSIGKYYGYSIYTVLNAAFRQEDFRTAVRQRWETLKQQGKLNSIVTQAHELSEKLKASAVMNMVRWNESARSDADSAVQMYDSIVENGESFISKRCEALSKGFAKDGAMLYYDPNGGTGHVFNPYIAKIGDEVEVIGPERGENRVDPSDWNEEFLAWNTEPDGTGKGYREGDKITLTGSTNTLYALWADQSRYSIIEASTLTLSGEISVNIIISPTDELESDENAYMLIKGPNDKTPVKHLLKDMPRDADGKCIASCPVYAPQMGENVSFDIYNGNDEHQSFLNSSRTRIYNTFNYSVCRYINTVKDRDDELGELVRKMENYGAWARKMMIELKKSPASAAEIKDPESIQGINADTLKEFNVVRSENFDVSDLDVSLDLTSKTSLTLYYKGDAIDNITAKHGDETIDVETGDTDDGHYVRINNICSQMLSDKYEITFGDKGTIKLSANSYVYLVLKNYENDPQSETLCETVKAIYEYGTAASKYFAENF